MSMRYEDMSGPDLAKTYNDMAQELGLDLVKKFRTKSEGIERVSKISIQHAFHHPNGATNGADMTNVTEAIRAAAQEEPTNLPDDPAEAKVALAEQFVEEDSETEQTVESEATEESSANVEAHQEFGDPDIQVPASGGKAKKAKAKETPAATSKSDGSTEVDLSDTKAIIASFKIKPGTKKEAAIHLLAMNIDEPVAISDLLEVVYESGGGGSMSAFTGVMIGIQVAIDKNNLPLKLEKSKRDGVKYLGLYSTK